LVAAGLTATALGLAPAIPAAHALSVRSTRAVMTSFDGTPIVYNLFEPDDASSSHPVPVIMRGHGWGGSGERAGALSATSNTLLAADYAVLTWDARGFGDSGGSANFDDPNIEGKDASKLIDLLAARPEIAQNGPGDPVVGMSGGSYGGGIQLALAAFDHRVDAIAPEITWNDLRYSMYPHGVVKSGWDQILYGDGLVYASGDGVIEQTSPAGMQIGSYAPQVHEAEAVTTVLGTPSGDTLAYFAARSLAGYGIQHPVRVPTLLMQGSTDTLFNLNEAWANYRAVAAAGAPVKLIAFCGGHIPCPSGYQDGGARTHLDQAIVTWFGKYLRHQATDTGAPVEYSTQDGAWHTIGAFPTSASPAGAIYVTAPVDDSALSTGAPTSPGISSVKDRNDIYLTDSPSLDLPDTATIPVFGATAATQIVGIPHVDLTFMVAGNGAHLFFKLLDRESKQVLDVQAESFRLDGPTLGTVHLSFDLVGVTYLLAAGHHLDLQVSTNSWAHESYRGAADVSFTGSVAVPTLGA